jgi:tetratricopeptide (TPR) repeat protein
MAYVRPFLFATGALFLAAMASVVAAPDVAKLREQLQLATTDDDTLSRIELLRRILDAEPGDTASHQLLVELWLKVADYDMAESALKAWPAAPAGFAALARSEILLKRDKDVAGAIRVLRDHLATAPKDVDAWNALADALLTTDDAKAQLEALDALIALQPDAKRLIQRAQAKFRFGDFTGAVSDAKAAQALSPDSDFVKANLPQFERLAEALQMLPPLDAAIEKDPKDFAKLLERSWWRRYGGMNAQSLADAEAALAIDADSTMARLARERARYLLDEVKAEDVLRDERIDVKKAHSFEAAQTIAAADLALAKNAKDVEALRRRAFALNDAEQYLLAKQDAEAAIAIDPKAVPVALEALYATEMLGQDPAALYRRIERMQPTKPQLATAAGYLADFYLRQSNLPLALEFADRSLALREDARILRVKAAALQRLNRGDEARAAMRRADTLEKQQP